MNATERDQAGRKVRQAWLDFWSGMPDVVQLQVEHPGWFLPWEALDEREREADRSIGEALYSDGTWKPREPERDHGRFPPTVRQVVVTGWAKRYGKVRYVLSWTRLADNALMFVLTTGEARILDLADAVRLHVAAGEKWPSEAEAIAHKASGCGS